MLFQPGSYGSAGESLPDYFKEWDLTPEEINEIIAENPPVLSTLFGYVAEYKLKKIWLSRSGITDVSRPRAHDRKKKGDFQFKYRGHIFTIEVKSLDAPKVRRVGEGFVGTFQCNASDSREVTLPNGDKVTTNCLVVGEFDVLAVNLFAFRREWCFAFAKNRDLPRSTWYKYTPEQQKYLLKSSMKITWPLEPPFTDDLFKLLDELIQERDG
ncbi:restriction endonuclease [Candidatus Micrarchaeota archaeon]|nr:MAG: restriction endonuclease [Candidatus Micrarchaeota archaeon]